MHDLFVAVDAVTGIVIVLLLLVVGFIVRRRIVQRGAATFELSLRLRPRDFGRGWVLGIARYGTDSIEWFRMFSPSLRPRRVLPRSSLVIEAQRRPQGPEQFAVVARAVVLECRLDGEPLQIAMDERAVTGFLSWLEGAAPGSKTAGMV